MKHTITFLVIILSVGCSTIKKRLALKECKFSLVKVVPYDFGFSSLKIDFFVECDNPNKVDAVLDKLSYTFYVNDKSVFSGTTGQQIKIKAGKSKTFSTTISLTYKKIGEAVLSAIQSERADYKLKGKAYFDTPIGEISYPIEIKLLSH